MFLLLQSHWDDPLGKEIFKRTNLAWFVLPQLDPQLISRKGTRFCSDSVLIDPIALKKKISKMSTELGAFAVLSSLLIYLTDLISNDSQVQSKKVKWLEDIENKMNLKRKCQGATNSIRPTKFQLLQSRFMNSNREPYRKRGREVGKLIMKEKQPANRNGLNSIAGKLDRSSVAEVSPKITPQEKVKCGKNTVKNILKKFLAAEEKEAKEKQLTPQKKAPDNNLPKIINRKFVMSKLKEKFEQSSNICSAIEVKALLPCKGKQKDKKVLKTKAILKAEIRELQMDLRTAPSIDSLERQHLVCTTVPLPKLHVATEISHPWSWTANAVCTIQPCDHSTQVMETRDSQNTLDIHPDENGLARGQQKGQLQNKHHGMPKVMTDGKDIVEMNVMPASPGPSLDNCPSLCKDEPLTESISSILSKDSINNKKTVIPVASNASSGSGDKNAGCMINKENLSPTCNSSNLTEGPNARDSHQDIKGGGILGIPEGMFHPQETEIEFTEPIKDHPFASQKCFPEQKALENIPPFCTPVVQASCNTEYPADDLPSSVEPAAVDKTPPLKPSQRNAHNRMKFCGVLQKREKLSKKEQTFSNSPVPTTEQITKAKQKETSPEGNQGKIPEIESEQLPQNPQIHPLICQPINLDNSSPNTSIQNTSQVNQASTPDRSHADNAGTISYDFENCHSPLFHDLVTYNSATAEENTGKAKACSADKMTNSENNNEKSSLSQIDASQMLSEELITHKTQSPEQNPWPDSEKCHSPSLDHSERPEGHIAEVSRPRCSAENLETPSSNDSTKNKITIREDKVPSQDSNKHHSSSYKPLKPPGITGSENKTTCNLTSDLNESENNATEGKDTSKRQTPKYEPPSSREFRKPEDNAAMKANPLCNTEKHPMPSKKETGKPTRSLEEEKSEKKNLPSQNEVVIQQKHNSEAGGRDLQKTVKCLISITADKKEQVEESSGDNKWIGDMKVVPYNRVAEGRDLQKTAKNLVPITVDKKEQVAESIGDKKLIGDKKVVSYSRPHQKSIKSDFPKNADDTTNTNLPPSFEHQHLPPLKHNTNDQELIHSPGNLKYQMPPSEPVKHGCATTGDANTGKYQGSSPKGPMKHEGGNGQNKLTKKTTPSSNDKEKSENKTRKKGENSGNLRQNQFSFKKGLPKNTGRDWNALSDLKKDEIPSNEVKLKQPNPAAKKLQKPSLNDSGNAEAIAKDDKQTLWHSKNSQPPSSDVKLETQQQPQPSEDYVKPQTSVRDKKHTHPNSEKYSLPSSEALNLHKKNASGKKGLMSNFEKDRVPLLNHDSILEKEIEHKTDTDSLNKRSPPNQRNILHSSGKYQILSPTHVSGPETSETQKCQASAGNERKGRLVGLEKYIAESYSEGPLTLSFKPLVVRAIDTIKLDNENILKD